MSGLWDRTMVSGDRDLYCIAVLQGNGEDKTHDSIMERGGISLMSNSALNMLLGEVMFIASH